MFVFLLLVPIWYPADYSNWYPLASYQCETAEVNNIKWHYSWYQLGTSVTMSYYLDDRPSFFHGSKCVTLNGLFPVPAG